MITYFVAYNDTDLLPYSSRSQKSNITPVDSNQEVTGIPFQKLGDNMFPFFLQLLEATPHSSSCSPFPPSLNPAKEHLSDPASLITPPALPLPLLRTLVITLGPRLQNNLPVLGSADWPPSSPFPCSHRFWGLGRRHCCSAYHTGSVSLGPRGQEVR